MRSVSDEQFILQLEGYSLVTAKIVYHMPDFRSILQEYIWQEYDLTPGYPELERFLGFWERMLEGPIHSVEVVNARLISPAEIRSARRTEFYLN